MLGWLFGKKEDHTAPMAVNSDMDWYYRRVEEQDQKIRAIEKHLGVRIMTACVVQEKESSNCVVTSE